MSVWEIPQGCESIGVVCVIPLGYQSIGVVWVITQGYEPIRVMWVIPRMSPWCSVGNPSGL